MRRESVSKHEERLREWETRMREWEYVLQEESERIEEEKKEMAGRWETLGEDEEGRLGDRRGEENLRAAQAIMQNAAHLQVPNLPLFTSYSFTYTLYPLLSLSFQNVLSTKQTQLDTYARQLAHMEASLVDRERALSESNVCLLYIYIYIIFLILYTFSPLFYTSYVCMHLYSTISTHLCLRRTHKPNRTRGSCRS